ncbi:TetR/AcrR family transcriptional regulator C-terminal domain-containing protein [Sphaerisporangium sp. NPDC005288]|uniref:TetR/AcrR family transcriptional regulator C-terminal domain-containing protein n=1 Tax=unclassified Sphaerisporangium TaxID=2630420 RepID=UPI0033A0194F
MPPLTRPRIVAAAIDLIEREGADAVSMRRIAADLGVGAMSLYNHVSSKAALLDAVAEFVLSQISFTDDPGDAWTERVRVQARAVRQIAHDYPRSTMLVMSRPVRSPAGLFPLERALATLREAGFSGEDAVRVVRTFIAYLVGSLMREVGVTPAFAPVHDSEDGHLAEVDATLFPQVGALAPLLVARDHEEAFEYGLDLLIRAIALQLQDSARLQDPAATRPKESTAAKEGSARG